ncbi:MAG: hypothetical protein ACK56I_12700, partial [bacterium]
HRGRQVEFLEHRAVREVGARLVPEIRPGLADLDPLELPAVDRHPGAQPGELAWRSVRRGAARRLVRAGGLGKPGWGRIDPWAETSGGFTGLPF